MESLSPNRAASWLFAPDARDDRALWPRWLFLRALGGIFLSVYLSLACEIHGLIGSRGILPVRELLPELGGSWFTRLHHTPSILWLTPSDAMLTTLVVLGLIASVLIILNVAPRAAIAVCWVLFLSFISVAQDFASYQSDGMLLEAGFAAFFFAPRGLRPGLGADRPPMRAARFLLLFEWFRIYFESGVAKLASGDLEWRSLTAMDHYYENSPLPSFVGWWVQKLPHAFHAATCVSVFVLELVVVFAMFLPRRVRIAAFLIVTPFQLGIIATANYAFLNYLVLILGVLLLDDRACAWVRLRAPAAVPLGARGRWRAWVAGVALTWVFVTQALLLYPRPRALGDLLLWPIRVVGPFGVANQYGLFASMTESEMEIEFQGTRDGETWIPYPFRFKPQDVNEAPGIYAPYQPRFEWNLWFAGLEPSWRGNPWLARVEYLLLRQEPMVLRLFRKDPFAGGAPPIAVRAVIYRYWFSTTAEKHATGAWWQRGEPSPFVPAVRWGPDGKAMLGPEE